MYKTFIDLIFRFIKLASRAKFNKRFTATHAVILRDLEEAKLGSQTVSHSFTSCLKISYDALKRRSPILKSSALI